ncbi:hypothetical protein ACH50O_00630 [Methylomonas sp. 2BW1-5-20]|uniref:hypothetical protein n=1 Tax=Methylomonas sp. 2BW1-5-20 TaxID=3376686 RepID=UPI00405222FF
MHKAFTLLDTQLFISALKETVASLAYARSRGLSNSFNPYNMTYGSIPAPTFEQELELSDLAEMLLLCFGCNCIFAENILALDQLVKSLEIAQGFKIRNEFLNSFKGYSPAIDFNTSLAELMTIHRQASENTVTPSPRQVFELVFKVLQIAGTTNSLKVIVKPAFEWLSAKWIFILDHQRFLLRTPSFYEKSITQACTGEAGSYLEKIIVLLEVVIPALGLSKENQFIAILKDIRSTQL